MTIYLLIIISILFLIFLSINFNAKSSLDQFHLSLDIIFVLTASIGLIIFRKYERIQKYCYILMILNIFFLIAEGFFHYLTVKKNPSHYFLSGILYEIMISSIIRFKIQWIKKTISMNFLRIFIIALHLKESIEISKYFIIIILLLLNLWFEILQEKYEKNLFQQYFDEKNGLEAFKELSYKSFPDPIIIMEKNWKICHFFNKQSKKLFKAKSKGTKEAILNKINSDNFIQIIKSKEKLSEGFEEQNKMEIINLKKYILNDLSKNQEKKDTFSTVSAIILSKSWDVKYKEIKWDGEDAFLIIISDIGRKNENARFQFISEFLDYFTANLSHEVNNPLSSTLGYAEKIIKDIEEKSICEMNDLKRKMSHILESSYNIQNILFGLSIFKDIFNGKLNSLIEKIDIEKFIQKILQKIGRHASKRGIFFTLRNKFCLKYIYTDVAKLEFILYNIIMLILKFNENKKIPITIKNKFEDLMEISFSNTQMANVKRENQKDIKSIDFSPIKRNNNSFINLDIVDKVLDYLIISLNPQEEKRMYVDEKNVKFQINTICKMKKLDFNDSLNKKIRFVVVYENENIDSYSHTNSSKNFIKGKTLENDFGGRNSNFIIIKKNEIFI